MVTATNSCKYCNQIATGQITQLIVANFATRIFAVWLDLGKNRFFFSYKDRVLHNIDVQNVGYEGM